jgi:hypothetical protein
MTRIESLLLILKLLPFWLVWCGTLESDCIRLIPDGTEGYCPGFMTNQASLLKLSLVLEL